MKTANAIESITDAGEFEILATRVLRNVDADYARLEHVGVNADGKTVKNPVDGFCKVPGSKPSRYVLAAFSTDREDGIERKMLFDHRQSPGKSYKASDDGDLIKANRLAQGLRVTDPDAEFVFTFCTNKQPSDEAMRAGYAAGSRMGIEVRFLGRSAIRDYLDATSIGQWLRKEHLGISAEMLSLPLLRELAAQSVSAYLHELFCSANAIVDTATTRRLLELASDRSPTTCVLVGPSGSGKSAACYRLLSETVANEGIGLWLAAETAADSLSLDDAVAKTLQALCPTLGPDSGQLVRALTREGNFPLVIVIDDVNRAAAPPQLVRKLISWNRRTVVEDKRSDSASPHSFGPHLIIPVWNHFWQAAAARYRDDRTAREVSTQMMSPEEAYRCLQACSQQAVGRQAAFELARRLEFDPILIGLWGKLYGNDPATSLEVEPHDLIRAYIRQAIEECSGDGTHLCADIGSALDALAERMLKEREFYPRWSLVVSWLSDSQIQAVRRLCVSGSICRIVSWDGEDRFAFRHDRLLEAAFAKPLAACLRDVRVNQDLISDPYLTESLARAIHADGCASTVSAVVDQAPLAVAGVLRYLSNFDSDFAKAVIRCSEDWLAKAARAETVPRDVTFAAARILGTTKNAAVLAVTECVKGDRRFSEARLVNGDAANGKFFVAVPRFFPSSRAAFVEEAVADARTRHGVALCGQLAEELRHSAYVPGERMAALTLAGYLGDQALAEPVLHAWRQDKENGCLKEALWAAMRCSAAPDLTLTPVLDSWASLSHERDSYGRSERTEFATELSWCMRHGVNDAVVSHLVSRARNDERLWGCLLVLLSEIDHPVAVEFVASELARVDRMNPGGFNFWAHRYRDRWDLLKYDGRRMSAESRAAILALCAGAAHEEERRSLLHTWLATTDSVAELLELPKEQLASKPVLWRRARLGDDSCVDLVIPLLASDSYWWESVPPIWTSRLIDVLDAELAKLGERTPQDYSGGQSDDHYHLSSVLQSIPFDVAQTLLLNHWKSLKASPQFFQVALYLGGEALLSACDDALNHAPVEWDPFEHIGNTFGFKTYGMKDRLTYVHAEALLRHVVRLPDMELMDFAEWLAEHGRADVMRDRVRSEISRRVEAQKSEGDNSYVVRIQRALFPSDSDLLEALRGAEKDKGVLWRWCHDASRRSDPPERLRPTMQKWFAEDPTPERVGVIAKIVREIGRRQDVAQLQALQDRHGDESTRAAVEGVAFAVRYRTLL